MAELTEKQKESFFSWVARNFTGGLKLAGRGMTEAGKQERARIEKKLKLRKEKRKDQQLPAWADTPTARQRAAAVRAQEARRKAASAVTGSASSKPEEQPEEQQQVEQASTPAEQPTPSTQKKKQGQKQDDKETFQQAFEAAWRKAGMKTGTFEWNGKRYSTKRSDGKVYDPKTKRAVKPVKLKKSS